MPWMTSVLPGGMVMRVSSRHGTPPYLVSQDVIGKSRGDGRGGVSRAEAAVAGKHDRLAFYTLHVWAWKDNPNGSLVNWHPKVSCESYRAPGQ